MADDTVRVPGDRRIEQEAPSPTSDQGCAHFGRRSWPSDDLYSIDSAHSAESEANYIEVVAMSEEEVDVSKARAAIDATTRCVLGCDCRQCNACSPLKMLEKSSKKVPPIDAQAIIDEWRRTCYACARQFRTVHAVKVHLQTGV